MQVGKLNRDGTITAADGGKSIFRRWRLGDKVEAVTSALGIKPCGGCKKRKDWLNGDQVKIPENKCTHGNEPVINNK